MEYKGPAKSEQITLREMIAKLQKLGRKHPEALDYPVILCEQPQGNKYYYSYDADVYYEDEWYLDNGDAVVVLSKEGLSEKKALEVGHKLKPCVLISP